MNRGRGGRPRFTSATNRHAVTRAMNRHAARNRQAGWIGDVVGVTWRERIGRGLTRGLGRQGAVRSASRCVQRALGFWTGAGSTLAPGPRGLGRE